MLKLSQGTAAADRTGGKRCARYVNVALAGGVPLPELWRASGMKWVPEFVP